MIEKFHFIKEDYSGSHEKFLLSSYKRDYPNFSSSAWKPGSSSLRIIYDHGGIFFGPTALSLKPLDKYLDKPFLVFDNSFESVYPNYNLIAYSPEKNTPIFLEFMEKGVVPTLKEKGFSDANKIGLNENNFELDEIRILSKYSLGFDKKIYEAYQPEYFLDTNFNLNTFENIHLHYVVIDENTKSNKVFSVSESFGKMKYEDGSKHFLLLVWNCINPDLESRIGTLLQYHCTNENKFFSFLNLPGDKDEVEGIASEYIGRKFNKLISCERI